MSKLKKYKEKIQKEKKKKKKSFKFSQLIPVLTQSLIYGGAIFVLAEILNWLLGLKAVYQGFFWFVKYFEIDVLYEEAIYKIEPYVTPYISPEFFAAAGNYLWLLSFAMFSIVIGSLFTYLHEQKITFKLLFSIALAVSLLKFVLYSVPYGVFPAFLFLIDFVAKFYPEPLVIFPVCFVFLFIGSESMVFWIKNFGEKHMTDKYK